MEIVRYSIGNILTYLILYIILHIGIGIWSDYAKKQGTPKEVKYLGLLFKWFPAIYVIFLLIMFYT